MLRYLYSASEQLRYTCQLSILTKYLARNSANFIGVRTLVDPEIPLSHLLLPWPTYRSVLLLFLRVWRPRQVSAHPFYPLTTMVTRYLAPVLIEGSLTR